MFQNYCRSIFFIWFTDLKLGRQHMLSTSIWIICIDKYTLYWIRMTRFPDKNVTIHDDGTCTIRQCSFNSIYVVARLGYPTPCFITAFCAITTSLYNPGVMTVKTKWSYMEHGHQNVPAQFRCCKKYNNTWIQVEITYWIK